MMKHIIHDWDDARASKILENIGRAMGGTKNTVLLLETVVTEAPGPDMSKTIDLEMLAFTGGRERTAQEFRQLFDGAGFTLKQIVPTKTPFSLIEATRR